MLHFSYLGEAEGEVELQNWLRSRKSLAIRLQQQVESRLGGASLGVQGLYQKEFQRCLNSKWKVSSQKHLMSQINRSRLVFLGDFHALKQSQKGHLRLLNRMPTERLILALECVESQHQKLVDQLVEQKISEKEFLKRTKWNERWGFPWEHYARIFHWAQEKKLQVLALNLFSEDPSQATLLARDRHAAEILSHYAQDFPSHQIAVIFGEQHLASQHLPLELQRLIGDFRQTTVFQNHDKIYFELLAEGRDQKTDVVQLKNGPFVILNVPPWVKWQDYLLYLERTTDSEWGDDSATELEVSDDICALVSLLCQDMHLKPIQKEVVVYTAQDQGFWNWVQKKTTQVDRVWIKEQIEAGSSFYLPEHSTGYLARLSVNHSSQLAMAILHAELSQQKASFEKQFPEQLTALIWREAFQYFGSKLLNPRRKSNTLLDLKSILASGRQGSVDPEPLRLALAQKMREHLFLTTGRKTPLKMQANRKRTYRVAARLLGGMLGEKFYSGFRSSEGALKILSQWLRISTEGNYFDDFYFEALEIIENWPDHFNSKAERL